MPDSTSTGKPRRNPRNTFVPRTLAGTRGPEPDTPLEEVQLAIGTVVGTHGLDGELRVRLSTDDPDHLLDLDHLLVGEKRTPLTIETIRFHRGMALIRFDEITDLETAERLRGAVLRIAGSDARPLAENEFYLYQVVGIEARTESGEVVGTVSDVIETGANLVFVVKSPDGASEELFPSIPEVVLDLRPAERFMIVRRQTYWDDR